MRGDASAAKFRQLRLCVALCVGLSFAAHITTLLASGDDLAATPISQLSRGTLSWLHSLGLVSLALAWILLASLLWQSESGVLWRAGCVLVATCAPIVCFVAWYFATASDAQLLGDDANDPLSALASCLGVAMGALHSGLRRLRAAVARANLLILVLWIGLILVIPLLEAQWIGAYERVVGSLMLLWTLTVSRAGQAHGKA